MMIDSSKFALLFLPFFLSPDVRTQQGLMITLANYPEQQKLGQYEPYGFTEIASFQLARSG